MHLELVLQALCGKGLTIKPSKCVWSAQKLDYLGFRVGQGEISIPEARVEAIKQLPRPVMVKQLRSFLGTLGFYRQFVPNFANYSKVLTAALKRGKPKKIQWTPDMTSVFEHLKTSLSSSLCLIIPTCCDQFCLITDASGVGIGGVLCVVRNDVQCPVSFYSRQLQERETRYSASELECLAVVETVKHFEVHLCDHPFDVFTDHKALTSLLNSTHLNKKL